MPCRSIPVLLQQDFDEAVVRQSPTFIKWSNLENGAKLKYACREFTKGHGDDEERLMRRIMIARRNNIRDHVALKKARAVSKNVEEAGSGEASGSAASLLKKRKVPPSLSDSQVSKEMDVVAVEATPSYRKWQTLEEGEEFVYNQKYVKGKDGHDWLLRKNIWRRMRYRRENKKLVETFKGNPEEASEGVVTAAAGIVDHALLSNAAGAAEGAAAAAAAASNEAAAAAASDAVEEPYVSKSVVEAAVAAAEQYAKTESIANIAAVHNPLEAAATDAALDAAAKLAAAVGEEDGDNEEEDTNVGGVMQV